MRKDINYEAAFITASYVVNSERNKRNNRRKSNIKVKKKEKELKSLLARKKCTNQEPVFKHQEHKKQRQADKGVIRDEMEF